MHILSLPSWYPDAEHPQRGSFFRDQARLLIGSGHTVGVMTVPAPRFLRDLPAAVLRRDAGNPIDFIDDDGIPTYRTRCWFWLPGRLGPSIIRGQIVRAADRLWRRYVTERGVPDVVHAQGLLLGGHLAVHFGRRYGVPVVVTEHASSFLRGLIGRDLAVIVRDSLRGASVACAVGPGLADALHVFAPDVPIDVMPNPVDVAYFAPPSAPPPRPPFVFALVAHLRPVKGVDVALRAFAEAFGRDAARPPQTVLRIAGDGPDRAHLEALSAELGLAERVTFLGALPRPALRDLYQASHVLVSASHVETFGLAVAEALACGVPVVATRSGGPDALVAAAGGWLTPVGDVGALAAAVAAAVDAPRPAPAAVRAPVVAACSPGGWVKRMGDIYARAVDAPAAATTGRSARGRSSATRQERAP